MPQNKLNICLVSHCFPFSSNKNYGVFVYDFARRLQLHGFNVFVVTSRLGDDPCEEEVNGLKIFRVKFSRKLPFLNVIHLKKWVDKIKSVCNSENINIIHAHFAIPSGFFASLAKENCCPLIITTHRADVASSFAKVCRPFIGYSFRKSDAILAVSNYVKNETVQRGADPNKVSVVYNTVDAVRFTPSSNKHTIRKKLGLSDNFTVFSLGGLIPRKGFEYLVRAVPQVIEEYPDAKFIIGGVGPLRSTLVKLSSDLNVEKNIVFSGRISDAVLPLYYKSADLFVLPSSNEGHSVALLEAMASGLPIITTHGGGNPETVIDGFNGLLVDPKRSGSLAGAILTIISDEKLRQSFGEKSLALMREKFSTKQQVEKLVKIYQQVLKQKKS